MRTLRLFTLLLGAVYLPLMVYSTPVAAMECTFGPAPFNFGETEGYELSITSDVIRDTPLYSVIPGVGRFLSTPYLYATDDISCERPYSSLLLPMVNVAAPPVIRTINYNGNTYDVYATNQAWAGYIVLRDGSEPFGNGGLLELFVNGLGEPTANMGLDLEFVKLADPLTGTVGQLELWLQPLNWSFDIMLPDGRNVNMFVNYSAAKVDVMGVVCSLNAPAELDLGDIAIGDLKQPGTLPAVNLALGMHCGSGYDMEGQRIPDSMQVQFMGGTEPGLLDSDQGNVKFQINDRYDQALLFSSAYEVSALTDNGNLTANNAINLSVKPILKHINGDVSVGSVGGNLGIQVIYK